MSGGRFNYIDSTLKSEIFGWTDVPRNVFEDREISELVWDVLDLIHAYDWYASGDTGEETYLKAKAEFKKKWFSNRGVRIRRIVDDAIEECQKELYETFGLDNQLTEKGGEGVMYQSPVEMIMGQMQIYQEGEIFKVVQAMDINIDKDELVKALEYDRNQYFKGYSDGYNKGIEWLAERLKESYGGFDLTFVINEILSERKGGADNG